MSFRHRAITERHWIAIGGWDQVRRRCASEALEVGSRLTGTWRIVPMRIVDVRERTVSIASPDRQRLYRLLEDDLLGRRGRDRRGARRRAGGRLRLQLERPLRPGRADARAAPPAPAEADPADLLDDAGDNLDPLRIWDAVMRNEKPGGHGERSVAVGTIDMAVWDAVAKIADMPLYRLLADRYRRRRAGRQGLGLRRRRLLLSGQGPPALQDEMRGYLDRGYTRRQDEDRRRAARRRPATRIEAVLAVVRRRPATSRSTRTAASTSTRRSPTPRRSSPTACSGTRRRATRWTSRFRPSWRALYAAPPPPARTSSRTRTLATCCAMAACDPNRDWLQFDCALSYGLVEYLRTLDVLQAARLVDPQRCPARRPSDVAQHRGRAAPRRQRVLPRRVPARSAASPTTPTSSRVMSACPDSPGVGFEAKGRPVRAAPQRAEYMTAMDFVAKARPMRL